MDYASEFAELLSRHGFRRFQLSRSGVGHLVLTGELAGRPLDIVLDTGAGKTFAELGYCRSEGIPVTDTGHAAAPSAGAGGPAAANVHTLGDARFTLDGMPLRSDGLFAIDMTQTNEKLAIRGVDPIRAVIGQDVLRHHQAVIDYATLALFLKEDP
ncbi:MAG TPA: hypothetical protein VIC34_10805 [Croceibacterium sp.]|jgi:hypothetical protein